MTNPASLPSFYCMWDISPPPFYATLLHFSHDLSNWYFPSFSETVFWKFAIYFRSTFQSVHVSAPYKEMFHIYYFANFFLKFKSTLLVKSLLLFKYAFVVAIKNLICLICCQATQTVEIFYIRNITQQIITRNSNSEAHFRITSYVKYTLNTGHIKFL